MKSNKDIEALLKLIMIPGMGSMRIRKLMARFKSPQAVLRASLKDLVTVNGIDEKLATTIKQFKEEDEVKKQIQRIEKYGAKIVTFWDETYPENLKHIYDPPPLLFVRGELKPEDKNSLAIVGTRQPTDYGKLITEKFTAELVRYGFTIVSGLAYGIDTLAHTTALNKGGRTLAILGSGVDIIYPSMNNNLARRIESSGAIISEFPMGTKPDKMNFPRRNRIICGLTLGTLVIEAGERSGALITAAMALEQNREVFAIPGNIDSPKSVGTNQLINQGAKLVSSVEDILEELEPHLERAKRINQQRIAQLNLSNEEKALLNILSNEPKHIDVIAQQTGKSTSQVLAILLSLELKDLVKQLSGKMFIRT